MRYLCFIFAAFPTCGKHLPSLFSRFAAPVLLLVCAEFTAGENVPGASRLYLQPGPWELCRARMSAPKYSTCLGRSRKGFSHNRERIGLPWTQSRGVLYALPGRGLFLAGRGCAIHS